MINATIKKTTVITTEMVVVRDGKSVKTTETVTSSSEGDVDADEIERAISESNDALSHVFDGFSERVSKAFEPFDRLFKKKP